MKNWNRGRWFRWKWVCSQCTRFVRVRHVLFVGVFLWPCYSATYRPGRCTTAFSLVSCGHTHFWRREHFQRIPGPSPCGHVALIIQITLLKFIQIQMNSRGIEKWFSIECCKWKIFGLWLVLIHPPCCSLGVVSAVVFIAVCALAVMTRLLYQRRQAQQTNSSMKQEHSPSTYTDYRTEIHNSVRDMKEYYIWWQPQTYLSSCKELTWRECAADAFQHKTDLEVPQELSPAVAGGLLSKHSAASSRFSVAESLELLVFFHVSDTVWIKLLLLQNALSKMNVSKGGAVVVVVGGGQEMFCLKISWCSIFPHFSGALFLQVRRCEPGL